MLMEVRDARRLAAYQQGKVDVSGELLSPGPDGGKAAGAAHQGVPRCIGIRRWRQFMGPQWRTPAPSRRGPWPNIFNCRATDSGLLTLLINEPGTALLATA
jgi:hypothetical protein